MIEPRNHDEIATLEAEIAEREGRLEELNAPMNADEAETLARDNPAEFNKRWEAARRAGRNPITTTKEDDR